MEEDLYKLFDEVCNAEFFIESYDDKKIIKIGKDGEYGSMETYGIFPGVILAYMDFKVHNPSLMFEEEKIDTRLLEINHCADGRYAYMVGDDKIIYFGKGDLCVSIYDLTKNLSDFPLGYYKGLELFIDVDIANEYVKDYIDFDLIEFYEELKDSKGYVLARSNERIDHVIGELYYVDDKIKESYFKLKTLELLLFFSITNFKKSESKSLSKSQVDIIEKVKMDLMTDLDKEITIDDLANKYDMSKTTLKNCFKEVYAKPIYKWRKEYKLDYACKLIQEDKLSITDISLKVGYSSPSKFSKAFKDYVGFTPSDYRKLL